MILKKFAVISCALLAAIIWCCLPEMVNYITFASSSYGIVTLICYIFIAGSFSILPFAILKDKI